VTTTYDPFHPRYFDEGDLRKEMERVYDLCHGCRLCFKFCTSFPSMFEAIDQHDDQDSARMTTAEQDRVVDECFQCKLCYVNCPYTPDQHEWALDFPRLMMRAEQVLHRNRTRSLKRRVEDRALGDTDLVGAFGSATAPLSNIAVDPPGSLPRKVVQKVIGLHAERVLPPFARQRFSTWFRKHSGLKAADATRQPVLLFPTCLVEYQDTQVGRDLVRVYERNGIECRLPEGEVCCGAPLLHQGDVDGFRGHAEKNVATLSAALRHARGHGEDVSVVVPQPTCGYVLKKDYVDYVGGPDAQLVADHTYDASEYLMKVHREDKAAGGDGIDTEFTGEVPETTTYHAPCHLRAQNIGLKSRDLIKLTGTKITLVAECSAIDGTWGLREENYDIARKVASKMAADMERAGSDQISGDCTLANGGITLETGQAPVHPLSLVARAYNIPVEGS
jgi:glycerol-3-phosphate dehydrogenase subunit C